MKKINAVLDETTIINFPFFVKLLRRYYITSIAIPSVIFIYALFFYINQSTVYSQKINFSIMKEDAQSASKSLAALIGEKTEDLTAIDILSISNSPDFSFAAAEKLIARDDFNILSFQDISDKRVLQNSELFKSCYEEKSCVTKKLSGQVRSLYNVTTLDPTGQFLLLEAKTLEPKSTMVLLDVLRDTLIEARIKRLQASIDSQRELTEKLIAQKKIEIDALNVTEAKSKVASYTNDLKMLNDRISSLEMNIQTSKEQEEMYTSRLEQTTKLVKGTNVTDNQINISTKIRRLEEEVRNMRSDISALELSSSTMQTADQQILKQLKQELELKSKELVEAKKLGSAKVESEVKYATDKNMSTTDLEFQAQVLKQQRQKTEARLAELKAKRDRIIDSMKVYESQLDKQLPVEKYLDILNNKLLQLSLMRSTVIPDVKFDMKPSGVDSFKRTSKPKVVFFALFMSIFILFIVTVVRYILDPRIYDEYELKKTFDDLEVIGKSPDFR